MKKNKSHGKFDVKTIGKYYSIFSDFIYKNRKFVILSLFIALSVFFSLEFYYIRIWDYLVRIMDAQFFFHGGTYFEIPRAILESVIIGLYGFVMGPLAIYGFIITATVIFFLAVYDFSKAFKLKMLLVLLILMNPYIIFYTMQAGSELMVFSFLILFVAEVKRGRAFYAGLFFVLAFISKYYAIFFIILALFLINKDIRKSLEKILVFIGSSLLFISPYLAYNLIFFHNFIYSFASSVKENAGGGLIPALPSNFLYLMLEFAFLAAVIAIVVIRSLLFKTKERTHWLSFKNNGLMLLVVAFLIGAYIFGTSAHSLGGGYRFILGAVIFSTLIVSLALNKRDTGWMFALAVIGIIFAIFILMSFADDGHINKVEMQTAISLFKSVYNTTNCTVQSNQWVELNYYGLSATYPLYNASASTQYPILNFGPVNTTYPLIKEEDNFYLYGYSTCKYTPPIKLPGYFYYRINQSRSDPSLACSYLSERTFNFVGQACNDVNNLFLKLIN